MSAGTLYVVATPLGNLEDITLRALRILREADLVAAEDTRRTKTLLAHHGINTPLTSLHEHNEAKKSGVLIPRLLRGETIAYVSDAGTPGISDPGALLVREAVTHGIAVYPVPGPSAVTAAISVAGFPVDSFVFHGFLPTRAKQRRSALAALKDETRPMVFFESPHRCVAALTDMRDVVGDRSIVVFRELTKVFEEHLRGTISDIISTLSERTVKGEFCVVLEGKKGDPPVVDAAALRLRFDELRGTTDLSVKDCITEIAGHFAVPRKEVYREITAYRKEKGND